MNIRESRVQQIQYTSFLGVFQGVETLPPFPHWFGSAGGSTNAPFSPDIS